MKINPDCNIHNSNSAICSNCKHRGYFFNKNRLDLSPEELINNGLNAVCDFCGNLLKTIDKTEPYCNCSKCLNDRKRNIEFGFSMNEPLICTCGIVINTENEENEENEF